MKVVNSLKDKVKRHQERHTPLGYQYVIADSIEFVNSKDWELIATQGSVFLSADYLRVIEKYSPKNTQQRYAIAYSNAKPIAIVACQIADIGGLNLTQTENKVKAKLAENFNERILVCGNLVSSGLHGVAFDQSIQGETGWRIVAEIMYKIRKAEQLSGAIDFAMIKDIKGAELEVSQVVERYSYRKIQTDPDMVLDFASSIRSFDDYLATLTSKYRSRIKKIIKDVEAKNYQCCAIKVTPEIDKTLHKLYLNVENKSATRLATLPQGYFYGLAEALGDRFFCYAIKNENQIAGFVSIIKDNQKAIAYYVGVDYELNAQMQVYFRLLQLVIECAIQSGCDQISFGRTALEPKASLGAKPVDAYVWARHRVPVVNFMLRKLFNHMPYDEAPERSVTK